MNKLTEWLTKPFLEEDINIPVDVGDTILVGKFKNKKMVVKDIGVDDHGMPTINGRKATTFRIYKDQSDHEEVTIDEGVNDPGIFKAVFLAGGPGSGKTYVAKQLFGIPDKFNISMSGLKMVNSDKELKYLLNKFGFGTDLDKMPDELFKDLTGDGGSGLRKYSKDLTNQRMKQYQQGKLGMIIDGTGHDFGKLHSMKKELEKDGYDTYMVFVNTSLEVAQKRNQERDRILPPKLLKKSWEDVQKNLGRFQSLFKQNFLIVDNSKFLSAKDAEKKFATLVRKGVSKFVKQPIKSKLAKRWIKKQQILKKQGIKEIKEFINKPKMKKALQKLVNKKVLPKNYATNTAKLQQFLTNNPVVMTQLLRLLGENINELTKKQQYELDKLYVQAFKMIPRSPAQMKVRKKIKQLRKKYKMDEQKSEIKKVVGIYGGRFQPFGPHHKKTYEWLKKQVDDAYITTSDIKQPPRHPMNFKEKVRHMVKMGIPSNRIIKEKTPYVAKNVLKKYDKDTTAVVYIFGAKDAGRLKGGTKKSGGKTYYQDYKKNKNNMNGYEEHGYVLTAPHVSVKVGGKEVSGTVMRQLLGSPNFEKDREKLFKKAFGYFDNGIYTMMTNKFKKLFEEFELTDDLIKEFLIESTTVMSPTDDGPPTFYRGFDDYKKFSKKWIEDMYVGTGWKIVQFILGKHAINPDFDYTLNYNVVPAVAYGRKQSGDYGSRFGVKDPINTYKNYISGTVLKNLGYEIIKWMGITPDGKNYTGVEVETPVLPGVGHPDDNVANTEEDKLDLKEKINLDEEIQLLVEGGAYGHMNHPFDDKNITFSDLKQIIINGLGGKLNREDGVTEKLDGQNLMVSWVNGKLVTARNKGQLKNFGSSAMDIKGVASKFAGRGDIRDAFVFAMKDLNKSIGSLSDKQKEKIFGNGKRWMNLEVMYPKSANVIDYDKAQIVFHGTLEYDEGGTAIGQPKDSARILAGMIKQVNQNIQKHYKIGKPQFLEVPKVQDFSKKKKIYLNRLKKLQNQYRLKDNDTLSKYHQLFWEEFIFNAAKQMKYKIPNKVLINLTKRWAFFDKSYKIPTIRKDIDNKKFLDWVLSFDKNDHQKWVKQNMKPFEVLFFDVGAEILKNISGYLAASPEKAVQKIRKDVISAIKTVKSGGDVKKIQTLKLQLDKLNKIGGLSAIVPSEGIVFKYKGNTYKFTGAFAPVNQILGLLNF